MFNPAPFAVTDADEADRLLAAARLGILVTHGPQGLYATHMPFVFDPATRRLRGHMARANAHRSLAPDGTEALVIFQGVDAYVSPNWYPSKAEDGRQVPTWNYEAIHVRGPLAWYDDPASLLENVKALSDRHEAGRAQPWSVADAPERYVSSMLRGIVGVEVAVAEVTAKSKLSQNKDEPDRLGAIVGLEASGDPGSAEVAALMRGLEPQP